MVWTPENADVPQVGDQRFQADDFPAESGNVTVQIRLKTQHGNLFFVPDRTRIVGRFSFFRLGFVLSNEPNQGFGYGRFSANVSIILTIRAFLSII